MNIAPLLRISGRVRRVTEREVPPSPAVPERRDPDTGALVAPAREAREGYMCHDVTVDTDPGGLVLVTFRDAAVEAGGGWVPVEGDTLDAVPVRAYDRWQGNVGRRYRTNGYSFAGREYAAETAKRTGAGAGKTAALASA